LKAAPRAVQDLITTKPDYNMSALAVSKNLAHDGTGQVWRWPGFTFK
jgi:hypothetical protein